MIEHGEFSQTNFNGESIPTERKSSSLAFNLNFSKEEVDVGVKSREYWRESQ